MQDELIIEVGDAFLWHEQNAVIQRKADQQEDCFGACDIDMYLGVDDVSAVRRACRELVKNGVLRVVKHSLDWTGYRIAISASEWAVMKQALATTLDGAKQLLEETLAFLRENQALLVKGAHDKSMDASAGGLLAARIDMFLKQNYKENKTDEIQVRSSVESGIGVGGSS